MKRFVKLFVFMMALALAFTFVACKKTTITLDKTEVKLMVGEVATVVPTVSTDTAVVWSSSNEKVATVAEGVISAVGAGSATITATAGKASATVEVVVKALPTLSFANTSATIKVGEAKEIAATASDATLIVSYKLADPTIASYADGKVTGLKKGVTTLTASYDKYQAITAEMTIKVIEVPPTDVTITSSAPEVFRVGDTYQIVAKVEPDNATNTALIYEADDEAIATVTQEGLVTGVGLGNVVIRISSQADDEVYTELELNVVNALATGVTIEGATTMLTTDLGDNAKSLSATVEPALASQQVTWTSSDNAIAIINDDGSIVPLSFGTVTFTATTKDGTNISADFTVTIEDGYPYSVATILVDASYTEANKIFMVQGDETVYKIGVNAFATLSDAFAHGEDGSKIKLAAGTYAEAVQTSKALSLEGPNAGVAGGDANRTGEAIITDTITYTGASDGITISGIAFQGKAQVIANGGVTNFTFTDCVATASTIASSTYSETRPSDFSTLGAFLSVAAGANGVSKGLKVLDNYFEVSNYVVSYARITDVEIAGNTFKNFAFDAIRQDGGYNGGALSIVNNVFENDTLAGYCGIYLRAYGAAKGERQDIEIKNNKFTNIGADNGATYEGAIGCRNYQEYGGDMKITGNIFTTCRNYLLIRNNMAAANYTAYTHTLKIDGNSFFGAPIGAYFKNIITSSDTSTTNPCYATMDANLFADTNGDALVVDFTSTALFNALASAPTNSYSSILAKFNAEHNLEAEASPLFVNASFDGNAGDKLTYQGISLTYGTNAFRTYPEAEAVAVDKSIIFICPGDITDAITITKDNISVVGNNNGVNPVTSLEALKEETVMEQPIVASANNITIDGFTCLTPDTWIAVKMGPEGTKGVTLRNLYLPSTRAAHISNGATDASTASFYFVISPEKAGTATYTNTTIEQCLIEQRGGRPTILYGSNINGLYILNNSFNGSKSPTMYTDGIKISLESGDLYGLAGGIVIKGNQFANYHQYTVWLKGIADDTKIIVADNTYISCCDVNGSLNHGCVTVANIAAGCDNYALYFVYNTVTDGEWLIDYRDIKISQDNLLLKVAYNSYKEVNANAEGGIIHNKDGDITITADHNYFDVTDPVAASKGNATFTDTYSDEATFSAARDADRAANLATYLALADTANGIV